MFILDFGKFSVAHSSLCNVCYSSLDYIGCCLVREKIDISVSRFKVSHFLCLFWMLCLIVDEGVDGRI